MKTAQSFHICLKSPDNLPFFGRRLFKYHFDLKSYYIVTGILHIVFSREPTQQAWSSQGDMSLQGHMWELKKQRTSTALQ